jgi:oligopeptide/dipeptide ABC transporter ATP-binding protein
LPDNLVVVDALSKCFPVTRGFIWEQVVAEVTAVDEVSLTIERGKTLGLAGESGSGKTTLGKCILQVERPTSGAVHFDGLRVSGLEGESLRRWRRNAQLVYQDPYSSLNPRLAIGQAISEPMLVHGLINRREVPEAVGELLESVGLTPAMADRYPHMFSGGQRQRIAIARALSTKPRFLVCDEPVSALDVSVQAQIINLLIDLQDRFDLTMLFISHDLSLIRNVSHHAAVMYLGRIVELAPSEELYENPLHPYTQALLSAVPLPDPERERHRPRVIPRGELPSPMDPPAGCPFHPRCPSALPHCSEEAPRLRAGAGAHYVACHLHH